MTIGSRMLFLNLLACAGVALASNLLRGHSHAYHDGSGHRISLAPKSTSTAIPTQQPKFTPDELYALQKRFLDNFVYPNNAKQAKAINSSLLAEDVQGRVDITRTFEGRELNTEYLFGLFANLADNPGQITLLGVPLSYDILHFAAYGNIVSASTRPDLTIRRDLVWWDWAVATLLQAAAPQLQANSTAAVTATLTKALAQSICQTATRYCNGTNLQYKDAGACYEYLSKEVRFGAPYELGRNTLLCRMVHQNMVAFRPSVHCPHVGPTGGGYCTDDTTYLSTLNANYFTNSPYIPAGLGKNNTGHAVASVKP